MVLKVMMLVKNLVWLANERMSLQTSIPISLTFNKEEPVDAFSEYCKL